MEYVILVNEQDEQTGTMEKLQAHQEGRLHRAFSVFLFNSKNELLLQQRAFDKYHSAGLWSNTCCSHPRPGESVANAAIRRLDEEMGIQCNDLQESFSFIYKADLEHHLIEHEYDHVFIGRTDDVPSPDPTEVAAWKYINLQDLTKDLAQNPGHYTEWFKICMRDHIAGIFR